MAVTPLADFQPMPKMTRELATAWQKKFLEKHPENTFEILCINGQFWWASRFTVKECEVEEVLKFIAEDMKRGYIVVNTGGYSDKKGANPATNAKYVMKDFSAKDRKIATKIPELKAFINECSPSTPVNFDLDKDILFCWGWGMATIENEIVSFLSKFVQNLESYRTVHAFFRKCPADVNYQVIDAFNREGKGSFGFTNILRHADLIDRPDF